MRVSGMNIGKEKNIGLITYYRDNYGSMLQCYAIKSFLESCGYNCHVLYRKTDKRVLKVKQLFGHFFRSIRYKGYFTHYMMMRKAMQCEKNYLTDEARSRQNDFIENVLKPEGYTWSELCQLANRNDYIAFIAGSDQIWNASIVIDPIYFLRFADKKKRIAVAPSFGVSQVPEYNRKKISNGLNGFSKISVREETGKRIVNELCEVPVVQVVDPTFLWNKKDWSKFSNNKVVPDGPYIFVHFLNKPENDTVIRIEELAKKSGAVVICFSYFYEEYHSFKKMLFIEGGPREYIALIEKARYVCTDSFHSTVFSTIFHKSFFTFQRKHLHKNSQSSRLTDMLVRYGLIKNYVQDKCNLEESKIDWNDIDVILENEREVLRRYIKEEVEKRE